MSKLRRWADYDWLPALLLAPIFFAPSAFPTVLVLAALALVPLYLAFLFLRYPDRRTPFNLPVLLILAAVLLSLFASVDLLVSLPALCGVFLALVLMFTLIAHSNSLSPMRILVVAWLIGFALMLLALASPEPTGKFSPLALFTPRLPDSLSWIILSFRQGQALNSNVVAGLLLLVLPVNLVALWLIPQWYRTSPHFSRVRQNISSTVAGSLLLVAFVLMLGAFVLTQSRSAFLGISVALLFLAWMRFPTRRPVLAIAIALLALFAALALFQLLLPLTPAPLPDGDVIGNLPARAEIWTRGVALFRDFPVTGIGLGTFSLVANALYPFFIHIPSDPPPHAHNLLLQVAAEIGILGLVGYLGALSAFVICVRVVYRRAQNAQEHWTILGLAAGMLAYQVYGLTDATGVGTRASLLFWLTLGVVGALFTQSRASETEGTVPAASPSRPGEWHARFRSSLPSGSLTMVLLAGGMILAVGSVSALTMTGVWGCGPAVNTLAIKVIRSVIPAEPAAVRLPLSRPGASLALPGTAPCAAQVNRLTGIELLSDRENIQSAIEKFEAALQANPNDFAAQLWLARATEQSGDLTRAIALWKDLGNSRHLRELAWASEHDRNFERAIHIWLLVGDTAHLEELARRRERAGDLDSALLVWQRLGNPLRMEEIANASEKRGELERAVGIWRELKNRPQLERLARSFEHTGDVGHALALWQELAEVEQIRALAWRALNAQDLDHAGAALEILEGLAREDPQLDALYLRLAENYTAVGDHSKARLYLQHVLTRKP